MNSWIFAGLCDKSDMLLYICKLLAGGGGKVLLVDATEKRKYPYFVGGLDERLGITEFSGFDVACGFEDADGLEAHLQSHGGGFENYDYVIYDLELLGFCSKEDWERASALVWATDYEVWTLEEGGRWLKQAAHRHFEQGVIPEMRKVAVRAVDEWFGDSYLDGYFADLPVRWKGETFVLPWNELDLSLKLRNEHTKKLEMKPLTRGYKKQLCNLVQNLTDRDRKQVHRALRNAERRKG